MGCTFKEDRLGEVSHGKFTAGMFIDQCVTLRVRGFIQTEPGINNNQRVLSPVLGMYSLSRL